MSELDKRYEDSLARANGLAAIGDAFGLRDIGKTGLGDIGNTPLVRRPSTSAPRPETEAASDIRGTAGGVVGRLAALIAMVRSTKQDAENISLALVGPPLRDVTPVDPKQSDRGGSLDAMEAALDDVFRLVADIDRAHASVIEKL